MAVTTLPTNACAVTPVVIVDMHQMFLLFCVLQRRPLGQERKEGRKGGQYFPTLILILSHHCLSQVKSKAVQEIPRRSDKFCPKTTQPLQYWVKDFEKAA